MNISVNFVIMITLQSQLKQIDVHSQCICTLYHNFTSYILMRGRTMKHLLSIFLYLILVKVNFRTFFYKNDVQLANTYSTSIDSVYRGCGSLVKDSLTSLIWRKLFLIVSRILPLYLVTLKPVMAKV